MDLCSSVIIFRHWVPPWWVPWEDFRRQQTWCRHTCLHGTWRTVSVTVMLAAMCWVVAWMTAIWRHISCGRQHSAMMSDRFVSLLVSCSLIIWLQLAYSGRLTSQSHLECCNTAALVIQFVKMSLSLPLCAEFPTVNSYLFIALSKYDNFLFCVTVSFFREYLLSMMNIIYGF